MKNLFVANILEEIADMLDIKGEQFKPQAYRQAANTIKTLSRDIAEVIAEGKLEELPGIGKNIAEKIKELLTTGGLTYYDKLKQELPMDFKSLLAVEGVGPKRVKLFYEKLGVKSVDDLEIAAKEHKIRALPGLGEKFEEQVLRNITFVKKGTGRKLLGDMYPIAKIIEEKIRKHPSVKNVCVAGSIRRMKETIGDIDILVETTKSQETIDYFTKLEEVEEVMSKGEAKATVRITQGIEADLLVIPPESFGAALMYFTGSKETNIELRKLAQVKKWKLNEYGLFKDEQMLAGKTENEIFQKLGMSYIEPELRENTGEINAAIKGKLPKIIGYNDIRGDLQMHTTWSDGVHSIEEMISTAKKMDYEYIAISDHLGALKIAGAMDEEKIRKQMKEIDKINEQLSGFTVLKGAEIDIGSEGKLDVSRELLKELDVVVASIHTGLKQSIEKLTQRTISVLENEDVDIIAHPTGRKILEREGFDLNFEKVFQKAKETKTYLEINAYPNRLDLNNILIKQAIEQGCKLVINTDSHNAEHLRFMQYGIATARRGWAREEDIINTLPLKEFKKMLKK